MAAVAAILASGPAAAGAYPPPSTCDVLGSLGVPPPSADRLEPTARDRWPRGFGGLWLTRDGISIAFTGDAQMKAADVETAAGFPCPGLVQPVAVRWSLRFLERLQRRMARDRERIKRGRLRLPGVPASGRYDLNIDIRRNRVEVIMERVRRSTRRRLRARYGPAVVVVEGGVTVPLPLSLTPG